MRYSVDIVIDLNIDRVIELFDSSENLKKWQPDLVSFQHISGSPGQKGAKSKLEYKMDNKVIVLTETIVKRNLPLEFNGTYETKGMLNTINNRFEDIEFNKTKWTSENEFEFTGMMKLASIFMKSSFPTQTIKFMRLFKEYAESSPD